MSTSFLSARKWLGIGAAIVLLILTPFSFNIISVYSEEASVTFHIAQAETGAVSYQSTKSLTEAMQQAPASEDSGIVSKIGSAIGTMMGRAMLALGAGILYIGGLLFDKAFTEFVVAFGPKVMGANLGPALTQAWTLIRDLCNLAFIFGFIYIGIVTILDTGKADTKKFLSRLIICAVLINFSLYFTQAIIDFANFTAVQIYNAILAVEPSGIASSILKLIGVDTIWKLEPPQIMQLASGSTSFFFYIAATIFLAVAGIVMGIVGFLIVMRFVELVIIMIFSPIYFGAQVFPQTATYSKQIMTRLISSALFAPVFLLLFFVALKIAHAAVQPVEGGFSALMVPGANELSPDAFTVVFNYILVIMLVWFSLSLAKKMGVAGGQMAINMGQTAKGKAQRFLGGATFGVGGRVLRSTAGRKAQEWSESDKLKDLASQKGWRGVVGRTALRSNRAIGDASFDARNVGGFGKKVGLGEGKKGGYKTLQEEVKKKEAEFGKSLGTLGDDDFRVEVRKKEMEAAKRRFEADKRSLTEEQKNIKGNDSENIKRRSDIQKQIDGLEKEYNDAKIKYETEKQRRIIGSTFATETKEVTDQRELINIKKGTLKKLWEDYTDPANINRQDAIRADIEDAKRQSQNAEKVLAELLKTGSSDRGYAGVLENRGITSSWIKGRLNAHDRAAGKEMRKTAEKGLPKEKE